MQKIKKIMKITGGVAEWIDERGNSADPPSIPLGTNISLEIDLRQALNDGITDELPAYPIDELSADSYFFALDGDYDHETDPKMLLLSGVVIAQGEALDDGTLRTLITATVPNTNYAGLKTAVEANKTVELNGEIAGNTTEDVSTFSYIFPVIIRNRVWYPDDAPESVVNDPDYLNSAEVTAYINSAVATAVASVSGTDGTSNFIYRAYASDDIGTDFSTTPTNLLKYMATIVSSVEITTLTESNFLGATWSKYLGDDGADGTITTTTIIDGLSLSPEGDWDTGTTYAENAAVRYNSAVWQSLVADNTGNEPSESSIYWQLWVKDGDDGDDADNVIFAYSTTADASGDWHLTMTGADEYFRISLDGGSTWSISKDLTTSQATSVQYNVDQTSDWGEITPAEGLNYSTGIGKYFRIAFTGGTYGDSTIISAGMDSQAMRVQFSATGEETIDADWHASPTTSDTYIRFFNEAGSIRIIYTLDIGALTVDSVQLSPIEAPWHDEYDDEEDHYMKISVDSGTTYSDPIYINVIDAPTPQAQYSINGIDWGNTTSGANYMRWSMDDGTTWGDAIQIRGTDGSGLDIDMTGTLALRYIYDSAAQGFRYLATDILYDAESKPYQQWYQKQSATQADWSDAVILYLGVQGKQGKQGNPGVQGDPGENVTVTPDHEFVEGDVFGGSIVLTGISPIAIVEVYDDDGIGVSLEQGDVTGLENCTIKTNYTDETTTVYFGSSIDLSNGGRIRFAQGISALSPYQEWVLAGNTGSYEEWQAIAADTTGVKLDFTAEDLTGNVLTCNELLPVSVLTASGTLYNLASESVTISEGIFSVDISAILTAESLSAMTGTWTVYFAGGNLTEIEVLTNVVISTTEPTTPADGTIWIEE